MSGNSETGESIQKVESLLETLQTCLDNALSLLDQSFAPFRQRLKALQVRMCTVVDTLSSEYQELKQEHWRASRWLASVSEEVRRIREKIDLCMSEGVWRQGRFDALVIAFKKQYISSGHLNFNLRTEQDSILNLLTQAAGLRERVIDLSATAQCYNAELGLRQHSLGALTCLSTTKPLTMPTARG